VQETFCDLLGLPGLEDKHLTTRFCRRRASPSCWRPSSIWDEERRACLRAELDALCAHLYGLTRDELDYILDTFPIVRRKDEEKYGEYRTKRMVLEKYDVLFEHF